MRVLRSHGPADPPVEMGGIIRAVKGFAVFACGLTEFHSRMLAAMVGRNYADPSVSLDTVRRTREAQGAFLG